VDDEMPESAVMAMEKKVMIMDLDVRFEDKMIVIIF